LLFDRSPRSPAQPSGAEEHGRWRVGGTSGAHESENHRETTRASSCSVHTVPQLRERCKAGSCLRYKRRYHGQQKPAYRPTPPARLPTGAYQGTAAGTSCHLVVVGGGHARTLVMSRRSRRLFGGVDVARRRARTARPPPFVIGLMVAGGGTGGPQARPCPWALAGAGGTTIVSLGGRLGKAHRVRPQCPTARSTPGSTMTSPTVTSTLTLR
jgi:hypothetical protein